MVTVNDRLRAIAKMWEERDPPFGTMSLYELLLYTYEMGQGVSRGLDAWLPDARPTNDGRKDEP